MPNLQKKHRIHPTILARARDLRCSLTPAENKLWQRLRNKQLYGLKFRRQHPIGYFILDFYCAQHNLVVELDGHYHTNPEQRQYDQARTEWLEDRGMRVIRFTNHQIIHTIEDVLATIANQCGVCERVLDRARCDSVP